MLAAPVATKRKGQIASTFFSLAYPRGLGNTANISSTGWLLATATAVTGARIQHRRIQGHDRLHGSAAARPHRCTGPLYRSANEVQGSCLVPSGHQGMYPARGARRPPKFSRSMVRFPGGFQRDPRGRRGINRACFPRGERTQNCYPLLSSRTFYGS
jgi:hypothetical protein